MEEYQLRTLMMLLLIILITASSPNHVDVPQYLLFWISKSTSPNLRPLSLIPLVRHAHSLGTQPHHRVSSRSLVIHGISSRYEAMNLTYHVLLVSVDPMPS